MLDACQSRIELVQLHLRFEGKRPPKYGAFFYGQPELVQDAHEITNDLRNAGQLVLTEGSDPSGRLAWELTEPELVWFPQLVLPAQGHPISRCMRR